MWWSYGRASIGFDRSIEEAAADLGAKPLTTFRLVTFPSLAPGIVAAALLALRSRSTTSLSPTQLGHHGDVPLYIYGASLQGIPVQVNVLATMLSPSQWSRSPWSWWQQRRAEQLASVRPEQEATVDTLQSGGLSERRAR